MDLVEVDCVDAEPREAAFHLAPERVATEALQGRPVWALGLAAFGEEERPLAGVGLNSPADDLLRVAEAVLRGGVDPVDA